MEALTPSSIQLYKIRESLMAISGRLAMLPRDHYKCEIDMISDMVFAAIQDIDAGEK